MDTQTLLDIIINIQGWLGKTEAMFLYRTGKTLEVPGDIVEIGSWKGKSTAAIALGVKHSGKSRKIYAVDPHEGLLAKEGSKTNSTLTEFTGTIESLSLSSLVVPVVSTSKEAARRHRAPLSFLFVDGLHDYTHAREDFLLWEGFVCSGGIIAFHDAYCGYGGVWKAVRRHVWRYPISHIGAVGSIIYIRKGLPENLLVRLKVEIRKILINLGVTVYTQRALPQTPRVFFSHKLVKLLLIDRATLALHIV